MFSFITSPSMVPWPTEDTILSISIKCYSFPEPCLTTSSALSRGSSCLWICASSPFPHGEMAGGKELPCAFSPQWPSFLISQADTPGGYTESFCTHSHHRPRTSHRGRASHPVVMLPCLYVPVGAAAHQSNNAFLQHPWQTAASGYTTFQKGTNPFKLVRCSLITSEWSWNPYGSCAGHSLAHVRHIQWQVVSKDQWVWQRNSKPWPHFPAGATQLVVHHCVHWHNWSELDGITLSHGFPKLISIWLRIIGIMKWDQFQKAL